MGKMDYLNNLWNQQTSDQAQWWQNVTGSSPRVGGIEHVIDSDQESIVHPDGDTSRASSPKSRQPVINERGASNPNTIVHPIKRDVKDHTPTTAADVGGSQSSQAKHEDDAIDSKPSSRKSSNASDKFLAIPMPENASPKDDAPPMSPNTPGSGRASPNVRNSMDAPQRLFMIDYNPLLEEEEFSTNFWKAAADLGDEFHDAIKQKNCTFILHHCRKLKEDKDVLGLFTACVFLTFYASDMKHENLKNVTIVHDQANFGFDEEIQDMIAASLEGFERYCDCFSEFILDETTLPNENSKDHGDDEFQEVAKRHQAQAAEATTEKQKKKVLAKLGFQKFKHIKNKFGKMTAKMDPRSHNKKPMTAKFNPDKAQVEWKLGHDNGKEDTPGKLYFKYYKKQSFVKMKIHVIVPGNLCEAIAPTFELDMWKKWNDVIYHGPVPYGPHHSAHYVQTNSIFSLMRGWYKIETILCNQNIFNTETGFCVQLVDNAPQREEDPDVPKRYCKATYQSTQTRNWLCPCTNKKGDDCTFMQLIMNIPVPGLPKMLINFAMSSMAPDLINDFIRSTGVARNDPEFQKRIHEDKFGIYEKLKRCDERMKEVLMETQGSTILHPDGPHPSASHYMISAVHCFKRMKAHVDAEEAKVEANLYGKDAPNLHHDVTTRSLGGGAAAGDNTTRSMGGHRSIRPSFVFHSVHPEHTVTGADDFYGDLSLANIGNEAELAAKRHSFREKQLREGEVLGTIGEGRESQMTSTTAASPKAKAGRGCCGFGKKKQPDFGLE